jgi:dihydrofolate reductase
VIKINLIAAMDRNRNIGLNDDMPWGKTMPSDLRRFKEITTGGAIVMGRKTYESIGRPLPDRLNIVMTRNVKYDPPELRVMKDMPVNMFSKWNEESGSLDLVSDYEPQSVQTVSVNAQQAVTVASLFGHEEVFVIGGAQIYQEFMPYADKIYITKILANLEGDTKFPSIVGNWNIHQEPLIRQTGDKYGSQYITYERVREE